MLLSATKKQQQLHGDSMARAGSGGWVPLAQLPGGAICCDSDDTSSVVSSDTSTQLSGVGDTAVGSRL